MGELTRLGALAAGRAALQRAAQCLAVTLAVAVAGAQGQPGAATVRQAPGIIVGGSYDVAAGTILRGDLTAIGATVAVAPGATLDGQLVAVGGTTVVDGAVARDVHAYGGTLTLGDRAVVGGDVTTDYAVLERAPGAVVAGRVTEGAQTPVRFTLPSYLRDSAAAAARAVVPQRPLDVLLRAAAIGLLAALVMALAPGRVRRVREAMLAKPGRRGLDGFLTGLVATLLLVLLAVTIVGIPLALVGALLLYASVLLGWIAFGDAVGEYLAGAFERSWGHMLRVAVGASVLALAAAILEYVPVLGALAALALSCVALGAVRATRYGGREPGRGAPAGPEPAAPQA